MEANSNFNRNYSILIPDGESPLILSVVWCLSLVPRLKINIISKHRFSPVRFSRFVNKYYYEKNDDEEIKISTIKRIANETNSDIILPIDQLAIKLLTTYKNSFTKKPYLIPLPDLDGFKITSDKWLFSKFLFENNLPHPQTILIENISNQQNTLDLQFPCVLKPVDGSFGKGIMIFDQERELKNYLNGKESTSKYILQSYIKGFDIDCSVLCKEGEILNFTIQKELFPSNKKFGPPAAVEFLYDEKVFNIVKELIKKLNWSGVAHVDLRYDEIENQFNIIEVNPRFWGSLLGSLDAGVNFPFLACLVGLGSDIPNNIYKPNKFSLLQEWIILKIKGFLFGELREIKLKNTNIKYILRDPLPEIVGFYRFLLTQFVRKTQNFYK